MAINMTAMEALAQWLESGAQHAGVEFNINEALEFEASEPDCGTTCCIAGAARAVDPVSRPAGCELAPHLRPHCAVHVCEQHLSADDEFTETYWTLRENVDRLLYEEQGA